jgi:type I restriction enzyme S subunit
MKQYNSYKSSGIEWLEKIPENWKISKLKYLGNLYGGLTGKSGVDFNNDENPKNKPYIPYTNIFNNTYISKDHYHYVSIDEGENQNKVEKYDMFFLMSSETHKDLGKSCILIDDVDELYLNSFCKGYRVKNKNIHPLFLNYQILGHLHREMISVEGKGFTRINLRQDKINDLVVFYPSLQEQEQIVNYLDEKTSIIDKLISTKERKIELLKEQRTSLINQVITKGLNPNVKMKDSGVEWIGEIPESWIVSKLKYDTTKPVQYGLNISGDNYKEEGIRFIRITDISENGELIEENGKYLEKINVPDEFLLNKFDVLFCRSGHTVGKSYLHLLDGEYTTGGYLVRFNFDNYSNSKFIFYLSKTNFYWDWIKLNSVVSTIENVNGDKYQNFIYPKPTNGEQQEIVEYLDKHTKEIDDLVSMEQKKIELLKEYRQSLISEVITGKIKVVV